jgi:hypothetical protein
MPVVRCQPMTPEGADFFDKLLSMEELANAAAADLVPGIAKTRVQQIAVLAQTLRVRLQFGHLAVLKS